MKAVVQRVRRASVTVDGQRVSEIGKGMLVLLGVMREDDEANGARLAKRIATFRFFPDEDGRMNRSILEVGGQALVVSQVTLAADGKSGRRPSLDGAAPPERARALYQAFTRALEGLGVPSSMGVFGAQMDVELLNDGPVTFFLEG